MKYRKILPAITTITPGAWRKKIEEVKKLGLQEIALFPTCLELAERKELYELLKKTKVEKIPFVHLRSDMELWELDYLIKNCQTEVFNTHTAREFPIPADWKRYQNLIYIENTYGPFDEQEIKKFAGICLDFSHLESTRQFYPSVYQDNIKIIEKYPCGCNHLGPAKNLPFLNKDAKIKDYQNPHLSKNLTEFDYLKNYPEKYFSSYLAIESENRIGEQLKIKNYVIDLLNGRNIIRNIIK